MKNTERVEKVVFMVAKFAGLLCAVTLLVGIALAVVSQTVEMLMMLSWVALLLWFLAAMELTVALAATGFGFLLRYQDGEKVKMPPVIQRERR